MRLHFRTLLAALALLNLACLLPSGEEQSESLPPRLRDRLCPSAFSSQGPSPHIVVTPTREISPHEAPDFFDDLEFNFLDVAIERQLERFAERDMSGLVTFGDYTYPQSEMVNSLLRFRSLIQSIPSCQQSKKALCQRELNQKIREQFRIFVPALGPGDPRFGDTDPAFITGYYTPQLEVSSARHGPYQFPIYKLPEGDEDRRKVRLEIDFQSGLEGRQLEMVYGKDLFNIYLLHLEGGGRVRYSDKGKMIDHYVSFAGTNRREWRFISELMLNNGWITSPSIEAQREFLIKNPQLHQEIFSYCPSYVYFRGTEHPPEGSDRVPLTDNRSFATDRNYYPLKGTLAFVRSTRPITAEGNETLQFSRFALDQDTGGAIRGKARIDFYFGEGNYAEHAAHNLKHRGELYFFMPR